MTATTTTTTYPDIRPLGLHERYCLARQNAGFPHIILHVVTYPAAALPSAEFLAERVQQLQARLPMLHPRLHHSKLHDPGYVAGAAWPASAIVRDTTFEQHDSAEAEVLAVYKTELARFEKLPFDGPETGPLWGVTRATCPGSDRSYLLAAFNHLVVDGRGSAAMVRSLTAEDISYIKQEQWDSYTRIDDTISLKPGLRILLPIAWRELFLTKMPYFVQRPFATADPWPAAAMKASPLQSEDQLMLVSLDNDTIARLKAAGKKHGINTLHPLLKYAYVAAMWRVIHAGDAPLFLQTGTARDERDATLGHAPITHNYISSVEWGTTLTGDESFWDQARSLATKVSSAEGISEGRQYMGLLSHIPNPVVDPTSPSYDPAKPTGWEDYFVRRASSPTPYRDSLAVSNLGRVKLPPGATDLMWGQCASPFGSAYMVNVIGHEGGVRVSACFREGAVTDSDRTTELHAAYRRIIERMCADADGEPSGEPSVADMSA